MNTTQRKFALKRVFTILCAKLDAVKALDDKQFTAYQKASSVPLTIILDEIAKGTISTVHNSKLKDMDQFDTLADIYNLSNLEKTYKDKVKPTERPSSKNLPQIELYDPIENKGWCCASISAKFAANYKSAKKISIVLKNAGDQIMLGNNSAALKAIQEIEARTF